MIDPTDITIGREGAIIDAAGDLAKFYPYTQEELARYLQIVLAVAAAPHNIGGFRRYLEDRMSVLRAEVTIGVLPRAVPVKL